MDITVWNSIKGGSISAAACALAALHGSQSALLGPRGRGAPRLAATGSPPFQYIVCLSLSCAMESCFSWACGLGDLSNGVDDFPVVFFFLGTFVFRVVFFRPPNRAAGEKSMLLTLLVAFLLLVGGARSRFELEAQVSEAVGQSVSPRVSHSDGQVRAHLGLARGGRQTN